MLCFLTKHSPYELLVWTRVPLAGLACPGSVGLLHTASNHLLEWKVTVVNLSQGNRPLPRASPQHKVIFIQIVLKIIPEFNPDQMMMTMIGAGDWLESMLFMFEESDRSEKHWSCIDLPPGKVLAGFNPRYSETYNSWSQSCQTLLFGSREAEVGNSSISVWVYLIPNLHTDVLFAML